VRAAGAVLVAAVLAGGASLGEERPMPDSDLSARLAAVEGSSTCRITTRGRRSGKPHTVTIWFLVEGTTLYLGTSTRAATGCATWRERPTSSWTSAGSGCAGG
jgi:hypothetical protein